MAALGTSPPARWHRVLGAVAAADWLVAAGMVLIGSRRALALPLLGVAAGTGLVVQWPSLTRLSDAVSAARTRGDDPWRAAEDVLTARFGAAGRLALREPRLLWSLALLVRRRYDGQPCPRFSSHRDVLPTWSILAGLAAAEVALTPVLPLPRPAEVALLLLGLWGLFVALGLVAALIVHPHVLTATRLRLRTGFWDEVQVPVNHVQAATVRLGSAPRGLTVGSGVGMLSPAGATNVVLHVEPAIPVRGRAVAELRLWADEPEALVRAIDALPSGPDGLDR